MVLSNSTRRYLQKKSALATSRSCWNLDQRQNQFLIKSDVPYALKERVNKELDSLGAAGIISKTILVIEDRL